MTQHDFVETLDAFNALDKMLNAYDMPKLFEDKVNTIRFALKLADKVMGEPSDEMMNTGLNEWSNLRSMFKAMIQQAIKEIQS